MLAPALRAFAVALALQPVIIALLTRRALFDVPSDRSNHTVPTPRGGGVAVILALFAGALVADEAVSISLLAGVLVAAAAGALEDLRGIRIGPRLLLTTAAALALLAALGLHGMPSA